VNNEVSVPAEWYCQLCGRFGCSLNPARALIEHEKRECHQRRVRLQDTEQHIAQEFRAGRVPPYRPGWWGAL
jgi:hypothetical protein